MIKRNKTYNNADMYYTHAWEDTTEKMVKIQQKFFFVNMDKPILKCTKKDKGARTSNIISRKHIKVRGDSAYENALWRAAWHCWRDRSRQSSVYRERMQK